MSLAVQFALPAPLGTPHLYSKRQAEVPQLSMNEDLLPPAHRVLSAINLPRR
jgi:hypothetical protein